MNKPNASVRMGRLKLLLFLYKTIFVFVDPEAKYFIPGYDKQQFTGQLNLRYHL